MKRLILSVFASVAVLSSSAVHAGLTPIGDTLAGNSWGQAFEFDTDPLAPINMIFITRNGGDLFEPIGSGGAIQNLSAGWEVTYSDVDIAMAVGPETTLLAFEIWFAGDPLTDPVSFLFNAFTPDGPLPGFGVEWDGTIWTITGDGALTISREDAEDAVAAHMPVPGSVLLGMLGIGLVMGRRQA